MKLLSLIIAIGFFLNALLHLSLIVGRPLGEYVLGGKNVVLPFRMRIVSALFLVIWTIVGMSYLSYGQLIHSLIFNQFDKKLIILTTVFLFFAIFSNGFLTKSEKERNVMTPFSLVTFVLSCIVLFF